MTNEGPATHTAKINFDEIFQKNPSQTVDFEIVFAGLLAASLASVSGVSPILDLGSIIGAIVLLFFTMVRRMALDNPFALEKQLMGKSLTIIFATTFFGAVYLAAYPANIVHNLFGIGYYLTIELLLFIFIFGILLLYEYAFRDFFLWAGVLFHNRHVDNRDDGNRSIPIRWSKLCLNISFTSQENLPDQVSAIYDIEEQETDPTQKKIYYIGFALGIIMLVGLLFVIGNLVRLVLTGLIFEIGVIIALLIVSLISLTGIMEFWFSRYGNASFDKLTSLKMRVIIYILAFFSIIVSNPNTSAMDILGSISRFI